MMAEAAKAPDAQKPTQEALERLPHTRVVPATVAACWAGARAKLAGGGGEARRLSAQAVTRFGHFFATDFSVLTFPNNFSGISFRTAV
jgi:hypothetical protein